MVVNIYLDGAIHYPGLDAEITLLTNYQRTVRVSAIEYVKVLVIKWSSISRLGRFHPGISMKLFRNLSSVISSRLVNQSGNDQKMRDVLTGAVTRFFLYDQFQYEIYWAKRHNETLSLIILDIIFMSPSLENYPPADEKGIKVVTRLVNEQIRNVDVFARWDECRF